MNVHNENTINIQLGSYSRCEHLLDSFFIFFNILCYTEYTTKSYNWGKGGVTGKITGQIISLLNAASHKPFFPMVAYD